MAVYKIADINIKINCRGDYLKNLLKHYLCNCDDYDFEITITENDIQTERIIANGFSDEMYESSAVLRQISEKLLYEYDGILFHGAVIEYKSKAYLFCAPSGTGKTTHIMLWKNALKDKVTILNGDKPFVRMIDNVPIIYGSPWRGKENLGTNDFCKLDAIVFVNRSKRNFAKHLSSDESLFRLLSCTAYPKNAAGKLKTLEFLEKISAKIKFVDLFCNMDYNAYKTALDALTEGIYED